MTDTTPERRQANILPFDYHHEKIDWVELSRISAAELGDVTQDARSSYQAEDSAPA